MKARHLAMIMALASLLGFSACDGGEDGNKDLLSLVVRLAVLNPCLVIPSPSIGSGLPTGSLAAYNAASVKGRLVSAAGVPVNGALVMVDGGTTGDVNHYGSHTGVIRDGYFEIAGILVADGPFRLAVESVAPTYSGRIDYHLDCYPTTSFTSGWYMGSGSTITTTRASAPQFALTAGEVKDLGTVVLLQ